MGKHFLQLKYILLFFRKSISDISGIKNYKVAFLLQVFLGLTNPIGTFAQKTKAPLVIKIETKPVIVRLPSKEKLNANKNNPDFKYYRIIPKPNNLWERFWRWVGRLFQNNKRKNINPNNFKYFMYALALVIAVVVILNLLKVDISGIFGRKSKMMAVPYEAHTENIHEMNFQEMIAEAVNQKNYRRATRLYYLSILKSLTDGEYITWSPGKTNRSYVTELKNKSLRSEFEKVTGLFEYIWYGDFALDESNYSATSQTFAQFNQHLTGQRV